jgi:hypothetical protein
MKKYNYEQTKYPRIFRYTYWGSFGVSDKTGAPEIIENRNRFVEEYAIKCRSRKSLIDMHYFCFDHLEAYTSDRKELVIIYSPYIGSDEASGLGKHDVALGFVDYRKLYSPLAITKVAVFKGVRDYQKKINLILGD